jgi:hypothetical protein
VGFRLPVIPAPLAITDGKWAGVELEIDAGLPPLTRFTLIGLMARPADETDGQKQARSTELLALLADVVLGWNVEDKAGNPIPVTVEGLVRVPPDLIATVIAVYLARDGRGE